MDLDLVDKLTEGGKYANEICLLLLVSENSYMLEYFDKYEISGRKLEIFANDCCNDCDVYMMREVLLCLDWDLFDIKLVHKNLESSNPIPFIDKLMIPNEGIIQRYKRYRDTFNKNMQQNSRGK